MFVQVWHSHMQPLADAMMALQVQKLAVGMQLQVRACQLHKHWNALINTM